MWIILGAALVFASSIALEALDVVFLVVAYLQLVPGPRELLLLIEIALVVASPVGSFILLVGLARAVRRPPVSALEPWASGGPGASGASPAHRVSPFYIALVGATISLIGGLAGASASVVRLLLPPPMPYSDYLGYLVTWALVTLLTAAVAAVGSFIAFVGVGLAVRNASRRAEPP